MLVLEIGYYGNCLGTVAAVGKSKAAILRWIKKNYPNHIRNRWHSGIFFESDTDRTWLRCAPNRCEVAQ